MIKVHLDNTQILVPLTAGMELTDIAGTTVKAEDVLAGYKFVNSDGVLDTGTYTPTTYDDVDKVAF